MNSVTSRGLFLLLLVLIPFAFGKFHVNLLTEVIIFALFGVSYNLLLGYGNLLSFGHAMFFGFGAYTTAVALNHIPGLGFFPAVFLGTAGATLVGFLLGCLLLRQKGASYALLTLAFNALFYAMAIKFTFITRGDDGLSVTRPHIDLGSLHAQHFGCCGFLFRNLGGGRRSDPPQLVLHQDGYGKDRRPDAGKRRAHEILGLFHQGYTAHPFHRNRRSGRPGWFILCALF